MKNFTFIVPQGHCFNLSEELFMLKESDLQKITAIGEAVNRFMFAIQSIVHTAVNPNLKLAQSYHLIKDILSKELNIHHKKTIGMHPRRNSLITRIDFMIDTKGNLKIAEIDPMNKHGLGFALLCRNEAGHGKNQKILTLLSEALTKFNELSIVISRKDGFFLREQEYFANEFSAYSGKKVSVLSESMESEILNRATSTSHCFLDCPIVTSSSFNQKLLDIFVANPKSFLVPPKHWMGNKAMMAFLHEPFLSRILQAFLLDGDFGILQEHIPRTYMTKPESGSFVTKKVLSSGAKGVFLDGNGPTRNVIYQEYITQKKFLLEGGQQYIRLAAHFIGKNLAELTATSSTDLPVHGGAGSINYHVGLDK